MSLIDQALNDTLAFDSDAVLAAMAYASLSNDSLNFLDDLLIESDHGSFSVDNLTVFDNSSSASFYARVLTLNAIVLQDQVLASLDRGVSMADNATTTDAVTAGLEKDAFAQDTVAFTEVWHADSLYSRGCADTLASSDEVYHWTDGILMANLQGDSSLNAVAMVRNPPPAVKPIPPPRTQTLPRPPAQAANHFVVNPTPPRRGG